ncbi:deoxycytidyl transferase [Ascosphaera aggregata]|nr:deoxycytidyl transferase [Ascosphaera aggregata]
MSSSRGLEGDLARHGPDDDELPEPGEEYGASSFGGFADYMRRKRRKLQNKDAEIRASALDKPQIFRGIIAYVNGYTQPSQIDLNHMIVAHGGVFMPVLNQKTAVTHIIASSLTPKKREEFRKYRVVKPSWVTDSIKAQKLLSWQQYSLLGQGCSQKLLKLADYGTTAMITMRTLSDSESNLFREQSDPSRHTSKSKRSPRTMSPVLPLKKESIQSSPAADNDAKTDYIGVPGDDIESDGNLSDSEAPPIAQVQGSSVSRESEEPPPARQRMECSLPLAPLAQPPVRPRTPTPGQGSVSPDRLSPVKTRTKALSSKDPGFIRQFYQESRLHHLATWKAQLKAQMQKAANEHSSTYSTLLKKRPIGQRRYILHIDFDSFFAAVAMQKNPRLKDKPVAVAHGSGPGAEIASCNYPARNFGVKNGMWMKGALQLCPELVVVPYDFAGYEEVSKKFYDVLLAVDGIVQSVSIDEALLDISALVFSSVGSTGIGVSEGSIYREQAKVDEIAKKLRADIHARTGCQVSVGIGGNILQARVALKKAKPAGQFQLKPGEVMDFFGNLPVTDLPGVAHSMGAKLEELGVKLVQDLRCLTRERLTAALGPKTGERLFMYARGIDKTEVGEETVRKSISAEINWGIRFADRTEAEKFIYKLCEELQRRCTEVSSKGSQFTMRIMKRAAGAPMEPAKHLGHGPCDVFNKSVRLATPTNDCIKLGREACQIFRGFNFDPKDIRGFGVQLTKLVPMDSSHRQEGPTVQKTLEFFGPGKSILATASATATPTKAVRHQNVTVDPDEIESPRKGDASTEALSKRKGLLLDPSMKRLNTTGSQFIMPPLEGEKPKVNPTALQSIPNDILSQLKAQSPKKRTPLGMARAGSGVSVTEYSLSSAPKAHTSDIVGSAGRVDFNSLKRPVSLPPKSALDVGVLSELPEDIRDEYLQQYSKLQHGTNRAAVRTASFESSFKGTSKFKPRKVHPAAWARFNKNITLTQSIFRAPTTEEEKNLATAVERPDPEVLRALPESIRDEVARQTKLKEQEARLTYRRRLNYKPPQPVGARYVVYPPRPEKPTFTSAGLTEIADIRDRISEWFEDYKSDGPHQEDTEILYIYLKKVVLVERDMAKAVALVNWVAWVVKDGLTSDEIGLSGEGEQEGIDKKGDGDEVDSEKRHDAKVMTVNGVQKTSGMWLKAVKQIKSAVNQAVRDRGLGDIEFDV